MSKATPPSAMSLEQQLKRLEEISSLLDRGELPLDEQLKIYEEGMLLAKACRDYLDKAQVTVEKLSSAGA
jgi:exodeoxyribonuclease VII small subunit